MLKGVSSAAVSIPLGCRRHGYVCVSRGCIKSVQLWNVIVVRYMSQSLLPWTAGLLSKAFPWLSLFFFFPPIHARFHLSWTETLDSALTSAPRPLASYRFAWRGMWRQPDGSGARRLAFPISSSVTLLTLQRSYEQIIFVFEILQRKRRNVPEIDKTRPPPEIDFQKDRKIDTSTRLERVAEFKYRALAQRWLVTHSPMSLINFSAIATESLNI